MIKALWKKGVKMPPFFNQSFLPKDGGELEQNFNNPVLKQLDLSNVHAAVATADANSPVGDIIEEVRAEIGKEFWAWYDAHQTDQVLDVKILFIHIANYQVRDLKNVFSLLFGPHP